MKKLFMFFLCLFFGLSSGQNFVGDTLVNDEIMHVFKLAGKSYFGNHNQMLEMGIIPVEQKTFRNYVLLAGLIGHDTVYTAFYRNTKHKVWEKTVLLRKMPSKIEEVNGFLEFNIPEETILEGGNKYQVGRHKVIKAHRYFGDAKKEWMLSRIGS